MTPAARVAAAVQILDSYLAGAPVEQVLTTWARKNRYAGSGDRAAIRDHVFDALRCRRSFSALGGSLTGRGLMIGALRAADTEPERVFTGQGYAPVALTAEEKAAGRVWADLSEHEQLDCPDWLADPLRRSLGEDFASVMSALRGRAPVFLRVNLARADVPTAMEMLSEDGIETRPHRLSKTALEVTSGARRIRNGRAFADGAVELQDAASQAVVDALPDVSGKRVLDYCAGGGGKSLALAALGATVFAHDGSPARMRDLPARALRAGVGITCLTTEEIADHSPFDIVLCDVPCSGSGAWRRQPEAKWLLTPDMLNELTGVQGEILDRASRCVSPNGTLGYVTCSLLDEENTDITTKFCRQASGWTISQQRRLTLLNGGDGFGLTTLTCM